MAHDAVKNGDLDTLMSMGDVSTILNNQGANVMHTAARFGQLSILEYLLKMYPQLLTAKTNKGKTTLHYAIKSRSLPIVQKLVSLCDDLIDICNNRQSTPLRYALDMGFFEGATAIISQKPARLDQCDGFNKTLMHHVVCNADRAAVRYLLTICQPGILKRKDVFGHTPIFNAVQGTSIDIVKMLINADPTAIDISDKNDILPVFYVIDADILEYLFQVCPHAIRQKFPHSNENLLHNSWRHVNPALVQKLLELCPALLDEVSERGESPLQVAFRNNVMCHVNIMLQYKPHVLTLDYCGNNALHMAVQAGDYDIIRTVFESCRPFLYFENKRCKTPFCLAVETQNPNLIEMFKPYIKLEMALAMRGLSNNSAGIDLFEYAMQQHMALNSELLPELANIVFEFLSFFEYLSYVTKKRKRRTEMFEHTDQKNKQKS